MSSVYLITNRVNGRRYVGKTNATALVRWQQHVKNARSELRGGCRFLNRAIRKYGAESFSIETIETCATEGDAFAAERFWIAWYETKSPRGYNLTDGGEGRSGYVMPAEIVARVAAQNRGRTASLETRAKMTAAQRARWAERKANGWKPPPTSEATRQKMSETQTKLQADPVWRERMSQSVKASRTDEWKRKHSERMRERWARRRSA